MAHTCPAPGCSCIVDDSRLACRPHWYLLPQAIRSRIWDAYRPRQSAATLSDDYRSALADAMAHWVHQTRQPGDRS